MNSADAFSADYQEARAKFREAAGAAGAALESIANPNLGPGGGTLSTDIAWIGPAEAEAVLVMISGTHGIEGFCGSGAQIDWLNRSEAGRLPGNVAVMMIHAVNPYGFAWLRRVTEENVDLNRNWIDFNAGPLPVNEGYAELREAISPAEWTDASRAATAKVLGGYVADHGEAAYIAALSGGQYIDEAGLFYGGRAPTWARANQTAIFDHYLGGARRIGIIDYHTGLGPWGYAEQIVMESRGEPGFQRAASWYGSAITSMSGGDSVSAPVKGDGLSGTPQLLAHAEVTGVALEFGTLPTRHVVESLRADNWLHNHGDLASAQAREIKADIRAAFYGDQDDWKGMVAGQSLLACRQAIAGLAIRR
jgi:hypothetical protein